jgi:hypothetical protein
MGSRILKVDFAFLSPAPLRRQPSPKHLAGGHKGDDISGFSGPGVSGLENHMTFGSALELMLRRVGYSLVSEFVTPNRRMAVRVRELRTSKVLAMYHSDAIELARGGATVAAIVHRNRSVFGPSAAGPAGPGQTEAR